MPIATATVTATRMVVARLGGGAVGQLLHGLHGGALVVAEVVGSWPIRLFV